MKKRFWINLLALCLLVTVLAPAAGAEETAATEETTETTAATEDATQPKRGEDECGDDLKWTMEGSTLYLVGSGAMDDYASSSDAPWFPYRSAITAIVVTGTATRIGDHAFENYDSLTSVDFGGSLKEIGVQAFKNCDGLTSISLPSTFRRFGASSFEGCSKLKEVKCAGTMPSFNANCLWNGNSITVYCPTENPWPAQYVEELETNFHGRLEVLAADGSDPYDFTEETTAATKPAETEPEQPTEATTQPTETTVETTETPTETTVETTQAPETEETFPETTAPEEEIKPKSSGLWIGILIAAGLLTVGIVAVLIVRLTGSRGGRYEQ